MPSSTKLRAVVGAVFALGLGACAGDFIMHVSAPEGPVAADGQTAAPLTIEVLEGESPIGADRSGTVTFATDLGSLSPIDVAAGDSPYPDIANQQAQLPVTGAPIKLQLFSAVPGEAHILVRYTDTFGGFALEHATVTFQ